MERIHLKHQEQLPDKSYSVSDIYGYFESSSRCIRQLMINHQSKYMPIKFRIELHLRLKPDGYYLELLTPETMKLLGSTEIKIVKDKKW